jgi:dynein heavy chain
VKKYVNPDAIKDDFYYSDTKTYKAPPDGTKADILKHISELPMHSNFEAFGLHENAEITTN